MEPVRTDNPIFPIDEEGRLKVAEVPRIFQALNIRPVRNYFLYRVEFTYDGFKPGECLCCVLGSLTANAIGFDAAYRNPGAHYLPEELARIAGIHPSYAAGLSDGWEDASYFWCEADDKNKYELGVQDGRAAYQAVVDDGMHVPNTSKW